MNPVERMNAARKTTAPVREPENDQLQYLLDKAKHLADEAAAAERTEVEPPPSVESYAGMVSRSISTLNEARKRPTP